LPSGDESQRCHGIGIPIPPAEKGEMVHNNKKGTAVKTPARLFFKLLLVCLPALACAAEPVLIGLNYPATGRLKEDGISEAMGAELAISEINAAGGVLGRPLKMLMANTASKPEKSVENVRAMAEQGAVMMFGGATSPVAIAGGKEAAKYKIPYFGTLTYANETTGIEAQRYMFRECHNARMIGKALANYIKSHLAGEDFFFVTADYIWGTSTEQSLRELAGLQNEQQHPGVRVPFPKPRQGELESALKAADASAAKVLILIQSGDDLVTSLQLLHDMNMDKRFTIIAPSVTLGIARLAGATLMENVITTSPWEWNIPYQFNYPKGKAFVEAFTERFNQYPSSPAASAYNIVYQFRDAAERTGSFNGDKLVATLENYRYTALKDQQSWRAFDHQNLQTVYVIKGKSREEVLADKFHSDFFEVISQVNGEEAAIGYNEWAAERQQAGKPLQLQ
jgi:branched-chain amino acid transport system substrate-binding protein